MTRAHIKIDLSEAKRLADLLQGLQWVLEHGNLTDEAVDRWNDAQPGGELSCLRYGGSHGRLLAREAVELVLRRLLDSMEIAHLDDDFGGPASER